ncbi:MAG: hypothetical protein WCP39_02925 [Chlamydiota bacterium]
MAFVQKITKKPFTYVLLSLVIAVLLFLIKIYYPALFATSIYTTGSIAILVALMEVFTPSQTKIEKAPNHYQELLDEVNRCFLQLKRSKRWTIGCLIVANAILWLGKGFGLFLIFHQAPFIIFLFTLAFLLGTKNLEKENEWDARIAKCAIKGIFLEKREKVPTQFFHNFVKSYERTGMFSFAFIRVSPALWIAFTGLYLGVIPFLSQFISFSYSIGGALLGLIGIFLGNIACQPYRWMLQELKKEEKHEAP